MSQVMHVTVVPERERDAVSPRYGFGLYVQAPAYGVTWSNWIREVLHMLQTLVLLAGVTCVTRDVILQLHGLLLPTMHKWSPETPNPFVSCFFFQANR